ncbi:hypothetical protein LTR16_000268 [Cryomyces antarcticus]|uniref:Uncharacterized protein n=1 Tax=Cryomyces antarcticus TaxID=329879 RepID=A0ABR0LR36_9PEZI|nr:hypothetical protein LTR39_000160 [Cryomyces antarcticus]KAK5021261.1 hypothetical protein LTR60_000059 [Cryomyces antarcticus]KAK5202135.1 hypothetical protein LTR16_000268 [Cryomyces antarcticus]
MPVPLSGTGTGTGPNEKPSTSETREEAPKTSRPSAQSSDRQSAAGQTQPKGEAEKAADMLYKMRIEEEYAKREGGA